MKRKKVLQAEPVKTKKEGRVITVQEADEILILNMYQDRKLTDRYAMNTQTGEYEVYDPENGTWRIEKACVAAAGDRYMYLYEIEAKIEYDPPGAEGLIKKKLNGGGWWGEGMHLLDNVESSYLRDKKEQKEERRLQRLRDLMDSVPGLPGDFKAWIRERNGKEYAFWDKEKKLYWCTACNGCHTAGALPGKHNEAATCPDSGKPVTIKRRTSSVEERMKVCLMQNVNEKMSVCRHFDVMVHWEKNWQNIRLSEAVRIMPQRNILKYACRIYYNQWNRDDIGCSWDRGNQGNRRTGSCYLYPGGIRECLQGTAYAVWIKVYEIMAAAGQKADYNGLMYAGTGGGRMPGLMEYLVKGRFRRMAEELSEKAWNILQWGVKCPVNMRGDTAKEVFGCDMQKVNRIRAADGGLLMVEWMQWSEQHGKKIPDETLSWLSGHKIRPQDLDGIPLSPQALMNYITRQKETTYKNMKEAQVLSQYADYLGMCRKLKKDMSDEMIYRPGELKRRHDEAVAELEKERIIEQMKENREAAEKREKELQERYPGAEENLHEIREIYQYTGEEYRVVVPEKLSEIILEGRALHHCAGSSERYFERIMNRETYIFFLRRTDAPDVPYYTLEVEPGGTIRQHRTMFDEETGIEEIRKFLRMWQQAVKKRLTHREKEAAKISAVKRQENLEELKQKNNTRVLKALMEDFMEAV